MRASSAAVNFLRAKAVGHTRNRFRIAGGSPGLEVSWQVTGVHQDDYAKAHPIVVETRKTKAERGTRQFVPKGSSAKRMDLGPRHLARVITLAAPAAAGRTTAVVSRKHEQLAQGQGAARGAPVPSRAPC